MGDSPILYQIDGSSYLSLMAAGISDLRHQEIFPAETENIAALSVTLQGQTYSLTSEGDGEERTFSYDGEEIDAGDLLQAMGALEADAFTGDDPTGTEEISLTATLDLEGGPEVSLSLYRVDGSNCLAVVDGTSVALVPPDSGGDADRSSGRHRPGLRKGTDEKSSPRGELFVPSGAGEEADGFDLFFIVQTNTHVFLDNRQLKFDGF